MPTHIPTGYYYTVLEASEIFGLGVSYVRRLFSERQLRATRVLWILMGWLIPLSEHQSMASFKEVAEVP